MTATALLSLLGSQPVIPVLRIDDPAHAAPLAQALARGGLPLIEITLRTPGALDAIREAAGVPEAVVGAGTVLGPRQFEDAAAAGARFIVSPGLTPALADAAAGNGIPFLPGASTASEVMAAREKGFSFLKFFPAEPAGGTAFLKALASPILDIRFCPTGGITEANARDYLRLPNVACVGGSWVAPDRLLREGRWDEIEVLAKAALMLRGSHP